MNLMLAIFSLMLFAGNLSGQVKFENSNLSWTAVKAKAKEEHKYIFVDCVASWCGPCREMDKIVYSQSSVEKALQEKFLSIKIQIDSTPTDGESVRNWYVDARQISASYKVTTYPTFLFFSENGELVHQGIGFKSVNDFISLLTDASNPDRQFFVLKQKFENGSLDYRDMPYTVKIAKNLGDIKLANRIASVYIEKYLEQLPLDSLLKPDNIIFASRYLGTRNRYLFDLFYNKGELIDSLIKIPGYATSVVGAAISRDEINAFIIENNDWKAPKVKNPDWRYMRKEIERKYDSGQAHKQILIAQINWYKVSRVDWEKFAIAQVEYLDRYGEYNTSMNRSAINNAMYDDVFKHVQNKRILASAGQIQLRLISTSRDTTSKAHANIMDSYANILYKSGNVHDAIAWQERAISIDHQANLRKEVVIPSDLTLYDVSQTKSLLANLDSMKKGIPTW